MEGRERRSEALPPTSKVKARGLGAILKHFPSLSLSYSSLSLFTPCSPPIPVSSASFFRSFSSSRLFSSNSTRFLPTRYVSLHAELTETKGTWHSATGMERSRANGSGTWTFREAQHCLSQAALLSRNSACTSSIFSPFSRPALYSLNDPLALVTLCLIIIARLSTLFYPILPLSRASTRPTTRRSIFLQRFLSPSPPPSTLSRDKIFILENGTNILKLSDYFPIVEAIRSFLIL